MSKSRINAYLIALYVFQFGFLQPIALLFNSEWTLEVFTFGLLVLGFINNGFKIKRYVIYTLIAVSVVFLFNIFIYRENLAIILLLYREFATKGLSALFLGSLDIEGKELYEAFMKIAVLNFILIAWVPFAGYLDVIGYMAYGYVMVPSVIMFFYAALNQKNDKLLWARLWLISLILTIVYGSRGTIIVFVLLGVQLLIFSERFSKLQKLLISSSAIVTSGIFYKSNMFKNILDYIYIEIGIKTISITKLRMIFYAGMGEASSRRDEIYAYVWESIKQSPIIGNGIGHSQLNIGFAAHNIFLQIVLELGLLGLLIWISIWIHSFKKYKKINQTDDMKLFLVVNLLIALVAGRLLVSSDMWLNPMFWLVLSILFNFRYKQLDEVEKGMIK